MKFRGYLEIYNNYFRDQNYQPPIPYSKLNIYNGFMLSEDEKYSLDIDVDSGQVASGSYPQGAVQKALSGAGSTADNFYTVTYGLSLGLLLTLP